MLTNNLNETALTAEEIVKGVLLSCKTERLREDLTEMFISFLMYQNYIEDEKDSKHSTYTVLTDFLKDIEKIPDLKRYQY